MKLLRLISIAALSIISCFVAMAVDYTPTYRFIDNNNYPTTDLAVATYNIRDYGADATGQRDCSDLIQTLCDKIAGKGIRSNDRGNWQNISGGVLYIPEGTYLMTKPVVVPVGVTIRGDWKQPTKDAPTTGTIIKACPVTGTSDDNALFIMQPCSQVCNLTVWYPEQDLGNVKEYAATFCYGNAGFWGNEYCNVRNVTLLNSYIGIKLRDGGGAGCPNIWNVYGTPLHQGIVIDGIADVGRFDWISFAPDYWANSGLADAPSKASIASYLRSNAVGVTMMRNDWSYTCNYDADSYKVGFLTRPGADNGKPNGHNYNFHFTNCETGVLCEGTSGCGIMFTRVKTENCEAGVRVNAGSDGPVQLYECDLQGNSFAVGIDSNAGATIMMQDCRLTGDAQILSGQLIADNNTFSANVHISSTARTIFTGNTVTGTFDNKSIYECVVSNKKTTHASMPDYRDEWMQPRVTKPAGNALYVVTDAPYNCRPLAMQDNLASASDCSAAIQNALNQAASEGGGIVYLPAGHYRMNNAITIPAGVELKGASDIAAIPHGQGAILECFVGEGSESGTPFITMGVGAGLRGVTVNYPNQTSPTNVKLYPYTVRGNKDVYIVNFSMRGAYKGVDLFTNKCDNHYVDYLSGHAFKTVITVGGGSVNGMVANVQCNTIAYAYGHESKFGSWPNSLQSNTDAAYTQNMQALDFFIIEDTDGEILYNNFLFGCNKGMLFQKGASGLAARNTISLGNAVDGAVNTFVFDALDGDITLTNSQIVALNNGALDAYFITVGEGCTGHDINFLASDLWGAGNYLAKVGSGTLNMINTRCEQSGTVSSFTISEGAEVNVHNGFMNKVKKLVNSPESTPRLAINSSVLDPANVTTLDMASYTNNLSIAVQRGANTSLPIPGTINCAFYDAGGEGVAYGGWGNLGTPTSNTDHLGWSNGNSWVNYTVNIAEAGYYDMTCYVEGAGSVSRFSIYIDNVVRGTFTTTMPGWGNGWAYKKNEKCIYLPSGKHTLKLMNFADINVRDILFEKSADQNPDDVVVPANSYGEYSWHVASTGAISNPSNNGQNVGWTTAGDWLTYTFFIPHTGYYDLQMNASGVGGRFTLHKNSSTGEVLADVSVAATAGYDDYIDQAVIAKALFLEAGVQTIALKVVNSGFNYKSLTFIPSKTDITIYDYATFFDSSYAVEVPEGVNVYIFNGAKNCIEEIDATIVPANTGLVFGGDGAVKLYYTRTSETINDNALRGSDTQQLTTAPGNAEDYYFYALTLDKNGTPGSDGFYWMNETGSAFWNGAHKAYLALPKTMSAKKAYRFDGNDDENIATGITSYDDDNDNDDVNQMYNLAGQRLNKMQKGINIVKGKKYVK